MIRYLIALCLLTLPAFGQYKIARSTTGKVDIYDKMPTAIAASASLWMPMDWASGTALYDYSANANNGVMTNGAALVSVAGRDKGYLALDGVNDHVVLPNSATMQPAGAFTIVVWERTTNYSRTLFASYNYTADKGIILAERSAAYGGTAQAQVNNGTAHVLNGVNPLTSASTPWTQVSLTHSGATDILYVNGAPEATNAASANATYNAVNYPLIGALRYATGAFYGAYWDGAISRCYLFNRALSGAEIASLYVLQYRDYYATLEWKVTTQWFPWDAVKYNGKILVSSSGGPGYTNGAYSSHIESYDAASGTKLGSLNLATGSVSGANGLIIDGSTIYVPVICSNAVAEIDAATLTLTAWITNAPSAYSAAIENGNLWIGGTNGIVTRFDRSTRQATATVDTGANSYCRRMVYDGFSNVWVTCFNSNYVAQISTITTSLVRTIATGAGPWGIMYDGITSNVWLSNYWTDTVQRIDIASGAIDLTWGINATHGQHDIVRMGNRMLFVCSSVDHVHTRSLTPGATYGNTIDYMIPTADDPDGLLADGDFLYVTTALGPTLEKWRIPRQ
jgi:hypothetical protein